MKLNFLRKNRIKALQLFEDALTYVTEVYGQASKIFTPASPYGQILVILSEIAELIFFYIEVATSENNILTARNKTTVYGKARLAGHSAYRGAAARGQIQMNIRNFETSNFEWIEVRDRAAIRCLTNNQIYILQLGQPSVRLENLKSYNFNIIQGEYQRQTVTAIGTPLQSFSIVINSPIIDNEELYVRINGEDYKRFESLYDMSPNEKGYLVKTGLNGGIDIYFGTGNFGDVPVEGSIVEVEYLITNGPGGNIVNNSSAIYEFVDDLFASNGSSVNGNELIQINSVIPPSLGSNSENVDFTRIIAPLTSKSFVLANPDNYKYFLKKYDFFSYVNAFNTKEDQYVEDDNIVYLDLIPNIKNRLQGGQDYFDLDESVFVLTSLEKQNIENLIRNSQQQITSSEIRIVDHRLKKYVINIVIRFFENFNKSTIYTEIRTKLSDYFINFSRRDRIPRSDLIALIEQIEGVDSVNVFFISEENETAIRNGFYTKKIFGYDPVRKQRALIESAQVKLATNEDPNLGLDEFGDILITEFDIPLIKGGWSDRKDNFYREENSQNNLSGLNVFFKESISAKQLKV